MKIGLFGINFGVAGNVDAMIEIAKGAEAAGIESVWTGEHVALDEVLRFVDKLGEIT
jgi:alkanesulfonate monooxygenase SsuD/methylene tetrahydromethanopterin reductase-like flavin-dependent oxidoreductase (luciferase family)